MSRRRLILIAVAALTSASLAIGGAAAARWTTSGSGSGAGATGSTVAATLSAGMVSADLYPGATGAVSTTAANPNSAEVRIVSIALDTTQGTNGFAVDAAHSGCPTTAFAFVTQTNGGAGWTVAANGSLAITLAQGLTMNTSAVNACQGVTVTVYLKAGT